MRKIRHNAMSETPIRSIMKSSLALSCSVIKADNNVHKDNF